jgi:hypothetical protein
MGRNATTAARRARDAEPIKNAELKQRSKDAELN